MVLKRSILITVLIVFFLGCSSDPETPIGSEFINDGILGSRPGTVYSDTLYTPSGAQSFAVSSLLSSNSFLIVGAKDNYRTSAILKVDFSDAGEDTEKTVLDARLRLRFTDDTQTDVVGARFYEMLEPFSESDTLKTLEHSPDAIPDEGGVNVEREMKLVGEYTLPPSMVQDWIRGRTISNGIVIVPDDTTMSTQIAIGSRENTDTGKQPFLSVDFADGTSTNYPMSDDATFVDTLSTTSNLIISDGFTRRLYLPVDLTKIPKSAAIHKAELVLHVVPGSVIGNEYGVLLYVPGATSIGGTGILSGRGVNQLDADPDSDVLKISINNVILLFLEGQLKNNGFVLRYSGEGSQIKQLEFYSEHADSSLRPSIRVTYSTPPVFDN